MAEYNFFFYVRKYMFLVLFSVLAFYIVSILFLNDKIVMAYVRSAQMFIGLSVLYALRRAVISVWKDDYRTMPPEFWPEHIATWGATIFWTGITLNGAWLLLWQLVDLKFPTLKLSVANSPLNGIFVLFIVIGGVFKFCAPQAYGGQLAESARGILVFVFLGTVIFGSLGIFYSDFFSYIGSKIASYLLIDLSIYGTGE